MTTLPKIPILSPRLLPLLCALASMAMLSVALVGQYGFNLYPCDLCIYQRIPYVAIAIIGISGFVFVKSRRSQYTVGVICALLFLVDAGIAGYHTGVEYGVFTGPSACSSDSTGDKTIEEIRAEILKAPLVTCSQAMAYFFGLSMAAWNMMAATLLFLGTSYILLKNKAKL